MCDTPATHRRRTRSPQPPEGRQHPAETFRHNRHLSQHWTKLHRISWQAAPCRHRHKAALASAVRLPLIPAEELLTSTDDKEQHEADDPLGRVARSERAARLRRALARHGALRERRVLPPDVCLCGLDVSSQKTVGKLSLRQLHCSIPVCLSVSVRSPKPRSRLVALWTWRRQADTGRYCWSRACEQAECADSVSVFPADTSQHRSVSVCSSVQLTHHCKSRCMMSKSCHVDIVVAWRLAWRSSRAFT